MIALEEPHDNYHSHVKTWRFRLCGFEKVCVGVAVNRGRGFSSLVEEIEEGHRASSLTSENSYQDTKD